MSGICLDALNPVGHPTARRLHNVHTTAVRLEIRDEQQYRDYTNTLSKAGLKNYALVGPSTNNIFANLANTAYADVIIIGNEPDNDGKSSWTMTPDEYIQLWNGLAPILKTYYPNTPLSVAGMLLPTTTYLESVFDSLQPTPDLVNKHYPNNEQELKLFANTFNRPVIVGEWCYKTATQQEMTDWVAMLQRNTLEHFWFCWSDGMVDGMGLTNKQDQATVVYRRYKKAIESLGGI